MTSYAVYDEVNGDATQPLFQVTDEDLELKKLLWTQVFAVCQDPFNIDAHNIIVQKNFMKALFIYLDPASIEQNQIVARWAGPQLLELQIHALNILSHLIALVPTHVHEIGGHFTLALFLQSYTDIPRRKSAMMAILNASNFEMFKVEFQQNDLIQTLLDVINTQTEAGTLYLRELSFNILSNICKDCRENQKTFRRVNGIEAVKDNLQCAEVDQSGNSTTFQVAVLDCLTNSIFGNKRSELHFLDIEGVQVLLDLIESCEYTLKRLSLSCLCTILENTKSFQYFVEWNSHKTSMNATQLLIKLYQEENQRYGVRFDKGILQDVERPLLPKLSYLITKYAQEEEVDALASQKSQQNVERHSEMGASGRSAKGGEASVSQADGNAQSQTQLSSKSKASRILRMALQAANSMGKGGQYNESYISGVLSSLVKTYDLRSSIFSTFYRAGFDLHELSASEKQVMELIQLYPFLKNGEIWQDIKQELDDLVSTSLLLCLYRYMFVGY